MQGRKIIIPGDGLTPIHLVHVDDLVEAFASVPGRKQTIGEAYSVCGPDAITATGYVRAICEAMDVGSEIVHIEPRDYEGLGQQIFPYEWSVTHVYSIEKARRGCGVMFGPAACATMPLMKAHEPDFISAT